MRLNQSNSKRRQAISLTPLIDVVFILLLFFMLSSSFIPWRQINVSMPTASSQSQTDVMRLEILDNQGHFVSGNKDFFMSDRASLVALVMENPDAVFLIKAKPEIETGILVGLLDQLTLAGAKNVSIAAALKGN
ncbi:ExbD/TolR family protein [Marinomonas sp. PE14-40]|uniref:ExbD/TolR family protein n=1 Tax=Marinomonas sp. PE14-40 TaxID=3060621 RepID=UPI003F66BF27